MTDAPSQPARHAEPATKDFRPGRPTRIIDARGRTLPLCTPADLPADAPKRLRATVRDANRHLLKPVVLSTLQSITTSVVTLLLMDLYLGKAALPGVRLFAIAAATAFWTPIYLLTRSLRAKSRARAAVAQLLQARVCPACAYGLAGINADPDGCTICPECAGAWPVQSNVIDNGPDIPAAART